MLWQDSDQFNDPTLAKVPSHLEKDFSVSTVADENEEKVLAQLAKYKDPAKDPVRNCFLYVVECFGGLISKGEFGLIESNLLSKDCILFVLDSNEKTSVRYSSKLGEGFENVFKGMRILKRNILETSVDVEKSTVIQICKSLVAYDDGEPREKMSMEIFSIDDHKITKYRLSIANITPEHGVNPLVPTKREKMLERVKQINYALADTPDFEKLATLLDEETEYKFWGWDAQKYYIFNKYNLVEKFEEMQERLKVLKIVPCDIVAYPLHNKVHGSYVYYLQERTGAKYNPTLGKKYIWISNCVYFFTHDLKLDKITRVGELYPEEEMAFPFEINTRETLIQKAVKMVVSNRCSSFDVFLSNDVDFGCITYKFGPTGSKKSGVSHGLKDVEKMVNHEEMRKIIDIHISKPIDVYVDSQGSGDDVLISACYIHAQFKEGHERAGEVISGIHFGKLYFENGKIIKMVYFFNEMPGPVPTPFDNLEFESDRLISRRSFYGK